MLTTKIKLNCVAWKSKDLGAWMAVPAVVLLSQLVSIDIELGKEGKVLISFGLVLVAFNMCKGWGDIGLFNSTGDGFNDRI